MAATRRYLPLMHGGAIRVGAVDDHPVMLRGLHSMADSEPHRVAFAGHATTVEEFLDAGFDADVVLLDLRLRDGSRPRDNVHRLLAAGVCVLVYTEGDRRSWVVDAVAAGARGVVLKSQAPADLLDAIEQVWAGGLALSAEMADILQQDKALRPRLAPREAEALRLVAQGLADKQVARVMGISEETVKEYLKRVRAKYAELGRPVLSRIDLHRRAAEDGFSDDPPGHADG